MVDEDLKGLQFEDILGRAVDQKNFPQKFILYE